MQPQIWNKYTYGLNNPLKYTDPDGRRALTDADLDKIGVPVYGTKGGHGSMWGNGYIPGANKWAAGRVQNFQSVTSPRLGDVAAWGARAGGGHAAIYIGGGATVYAQGQVGVKVQTVNYVTADQQRPVSYMRYKP